MTATSRYIRVCVKPIGYISYEDGKGYRDTQGIMPGRDVAELVKVRFGDAGLPAGWTQTVVYFGK